MLFNSFAVALKRNPKTFVKNADIVEIHCFTNGNPPFCEVYALFFQWDTVSFRSDSAGFETPSNTNAFQWFCNGVKDEIPGLLQIVDIVKIHCFTNCNTFIS